MPIESNELSLLKSVFTFEITSQHLTKLKYRQQVIEMDNDLKSDHLFIPSKIVIKNRLNLEMHEHKPQVEYTTLESVCKECNTISFLDI